MTAPRSARPLTTAPLAGALLVAALVAGCSFGADLDTSEVVPCTSDAECPQGQICSLDGYCFAGERDSVIDVPGDLPGDLDVLDTDDDLDLDDTSMPDLVDTIDADTADGIDMVDGDTTPGDMDMDTDVDDCGGQTCSASELCCMLADGSEGCVDPQLDPAHCGACAQPCGELELCEAGMCACPLSDTGTTELCDTAAGEVCCSKGCTNTQTSLNNCGGCGLACNPGELCVDGACTCGESGAACDPGVVCCAGACCGDTDALCCEDLCKPPSDPSCECGTQGVCPVDQICCRDGADPTCSGLQADPLNCGSCGLACAAGESCVDGACVCSEGFTDCDADPVNGCEISTATDDANCGACANACPSGQSCQSGTCVCPNGEPIDSINNCGFCANACSPGQACCNSACVNLTNDEAHCSACGTACASGQQCCTGTCLDTSADEANCGLCGNACGAGQQCCGGICQDLINDANHCGACGNVCGAGQQCCNGGCVDVASSASHCGFCGNACGAGRSCCGGVCRTLGTDVANCGSCGNDCTAPANATALCTGGGCDFQCLPGFADCDGLPSTGCEVNLATNASHCSGCGNACSQFHGTASCVSGSCEIACESGWRNCDGSAMNGCEIQTSADELNCGTCGTVCSSDNGTPTCSGGACTIMCSANFANCNGNVTDGCEVDLRSDSAHCNACNNACPGGQVCVSGVCTSSNCAIPGQIECSGTCFDLQTSSTHCGSCTTDCTAHANVSSASCSGASCGYICEPGFGNCTPSAGCETNTNTSTTHCGACNNACVAINGSATCTNGSCGVSCNPGFGNCDGSAANGCEKSLNTDVLNCGACNVVCSGTNGTPSCNLGQCAITCNPGFADCDGNPSNGCEVDTRNTPTHCGACNNACSTNHSTPGCSSGQCTVNCQSGWGNCNGSAGDGCETSLSTGSNCAACGVFCGGQESCCPSGCARLDRDEQNCGTCGNVCAAINGSATCSGGACSIVCSSGFRNCDGNPANGCEHQGTTCPEVCGDGIDNDGDFSTDCNDVDCRDHATCTPACPEYALGTASGSGVVSRSNNLEQNNFTGSCGGGSGRDASYGWQAPFAACWRIDTVGSSLDTVLHLYGTCGGSELGCSNDAAGLGTASRIQTQLAANTQRIIVVDAATTATNTYTLNLVALGTSCAGEILCADGLDNDGNGQADCSDANCTVADVCDTDCALTNLGSAVGNGVATGSTVGQVNDFTASCGLSANSADVAYFWTPPTTGTWVLSLAGSSYDTVLHVKTGCSGSELACNDDFGGLQSQVSVALTAGVPVLIVVDGYSSTNSGSYVLSINPL